MISFIVASVEKYGKDLKDICHENEFSAALKAVTSHTFRAQTYLAHVLMRSAEVSETEKPNQVLRNV